MVVAVYLLREGADVHPESDDEFRQELEVSVVLEDVVKDYALFRFAFGIELRKAVDLDQESVFVDDILAVRHGFVVTADVDAELFEGVDDVAVLAVVGGKPPGDELLGYACEFRELFVVYLQRFEDLDEESHVLLVGVLCSFCGIDARPPVFVPVSFVLPVVSFVIVLRVMLGFIGRVHDVCF